jgi:hypothetical protein
MSEQNKVVETNVEANILSVPARRAIGAIYDSINITFGKSIDLITNHRPNDQINRTAYHFPLSVIAERAVATDHIANILASRPSKSAPLTEGWGSGWTQRPPVIGAIYSSIDIKLGKSINSITNPMPGDQIARTAQSTSL